MGKEKVMKEKLWWCIWFRKWNYNVNRNRFAMESEW